MFCRRGEKRTICLFLVNVQENLLPRVTSFFVENAEEQENKETLKRGKDCEENFEYIFYTSDREGEYGKQPTKTEDSHNSSDAEQKSYDCHTFYFWFSFITLIMIAFAFPHLMPYQSYYDTSK